MDGLSNKEANNISEFIRNEEKKWTWKIIFKKIITNFLPYGLCILCTIILFISFGISFTYTTEYRLLSEALIFLFILIVNGFLIFKDQKYSVLRKVLRMKTHLRKFKQMKNGTSTLDEKLFLSATTSYFVRREARWAQLPLNFLVKGDIISLKAGDSVPCAVCEFTLHKDEIVGGRNKISKGTKISKDARRSCYIINSPITNIYDSSDNDLFDTFSSDDPDCKRDQTGDWKDLFPGARLYLLEETPAISHLEEIFEFSRLDEKIYAYNDTSKFQSASLPLQKIKLTAKRSAMLLLMLSLIVSYAINIAKYVVQRDHQTWYEMFLVREAYLCIPLLMIASVWLGKFIHSASNSIILSLFHTFQTERASLTEHNEKEGAFFDDEELGHSNHLIPDNINRYLFLDYFWTLVTNSNHAISSPSSMSFSAYNPSLVQLLASINVICTIDREGVLSDNVDYVEQVCFFADGKPVILKLSRENEEIVKKKKKKIVDKKPRKIKQDQNNQKTIIIDGEEYEKNEENTSLEEEEESEIEEKEEEETQSSNIENTDRTVSLPMITRCKYNIRFDANDWKEHMGSLKPLGLNCLLNSFCKFGKYNQEMIRDPNHTLVISKSLNTNIHDVYVPCTCLLGIEIGFDESALDGYIPLKNIYSFSKCSKISKKYRSVLIKKQEGVEKNHRERAMSYGYDYYPQISDDEEEDLVNYHTISTIVFSTESNQLQLHTKGSLRSILQLSKYYWDGKEVKINPFNFDEIVRLLEIEKTFSLYNCVSYSVKVPITKKNFPLLMEQDFIPAAYKDIVKLQNDQNDMMENESEMEQDENLDLDKNLTDNPQNKLNGFHGQIFIGMIALKQLQRVEMESFIKTLKTAGIRFAFFSKEGSRKAKKFAELMGLETDWNCAISLFAKKAVHDNTPACLPRGISAIRDHILTTDNVPLLVPIFYNATPPTCREMIRIYQEYGNVVCCIGSALQTDNIGCFLQSDLSIAYQPMIKRCLNLENQSPDIEEEKISSSNFLRKQTCGSLSADLITLSCDLIMHMKTSFHTITYLIQKAREVFINYEQSLIFYLGALLSLHFILLADYLAFLPTIFTGVQLFWLTVFIIPSLSFALLFSPRAPNLMTRINWKRNQFVKKNIVRGISQYFYQIFPLTLFILLIFALALGLSQREGVGTVFGFGPAEYFQSQEYHQSLITSQNVTLLVYVIILFAYSFTFIQQQDSIFSAPRLFFSPFWVITVIILLFLQVGFFFGYINNFTKFFFINSAYVLVGLLWAGEMIVVDAFMKRRYRNWYKDEQDFAKLDFDTKLGMYSPVSPFHDKS